MTEEYKVLTEGLLSLVQREEDTYKAREPKSQENIDAAREYDLVMRELEREEVRYTSMR